MGFLPQHTGDMSHQDTTPTKPQNSSSYWSINRITEKNP